MNEDNIPTITRSTPIARKMIELIDRDTPMKPIKQELQYQTNGKPRKIGVCQKCDGFVGVIDNFCSKCGQHLDWSADND